MHDNAFHLMTAIEAEEELGAKYFYRQRTYRLRDGKKLKAFQFRGQQCFMRSMLLGVYVNELEQKIHDQFPELSNYRAYYDLESSRMIIDGVFGRYVAVDTARQTEEDLLTKLRNILEWLATDEDASETTSATTMQQDVDKPVTTTDNESLDVGFPEEIQILRVESSDVEGVPVKSFILISLPSIAQFIGVKSDRFSEWVQQTTFTDFVVSIHPTKRNGPEISGPFRKGFVQGFSPYLPLELIPELLVAFRQSGRKPSYPGRAEQLYNLAKSTLEAVGLAIGGKGDRAAAELARVSEGLGISAADQVIEIFKRYESRPFQVETNLKFRGKVKNEGKNYKLITGSITIGVTGRPASYWMSLGTIRQLPSKQRTSGREVMRTLSPGDSVGVTFSESHYLKDSSNLEEVIKTGKQGKEFYNRLKEVGLLDD